MIVFCSYTGVAGAKKTGQNKNPSGAAGNITIPAGKSMASKVTSTAAYSNNLNASTTGSKISSILVNYADGTSETVANYSPTETLTGKIALTTSTGETIALDATAGYSFKHGR